MEADTVARELLDHGVPVNALLSRVDLVPMNCVAEVYHVLTALRSFHSHNPWFTRTGAQVPLSDDVKSYLSTVLSGAIHAQGRYLMPYVMPALLPQPLYGIEPSLELRTLI